MLEVIRTEKGSYFTNSYIIRDTLSGEAAVIDPGVFDSDYRQLLTSLGIERLKYIFLTHGHFDHICGAVPMKNEFAGEICIHETDEVCLRREDISLTASVKGYTLTPGEADTAFSDGAEFMLGDNLIKVMHTPGHTPGSVIFITDEYIFSGDTLFRGTMGRTDLPGGSTKSIFRSLRAIGQMQGEYTIFPGHGEETSLSYEKRNNRYLRANDTSHG